MATQGSIYFNKNDGKYYTPDGQGGWKPASLQEMGKASISPVEIVANEQGLPGLSGMFQRWKIKGFGNDGESDRLFVEDALKKKTVKYGDGSYDWGVVGDDGKVRLMDPTMSYGALQAKGGRASFFDYPLSVVLSRHPLATVKAGLAEDYRRTEEFVRDILDLSVDTIQGSIIGAATTGGLITGPITGTAAGSGTEYVRQKIGQFLGINRKISPEQVALSGGLSGAIPAGASAIRAARFLKNKGKEVGKEAIARLVVRERASGAQASETTDVGLLDLRVLDPAKAGEKLPAVSSSVKSIRDEIAKAADETFPETPVVRQMEENTTEPVDLLPFLDELSRMTKVETDAENVAVEVPASVKAALDIGVDENLPAQMNGIIDKVYTVLNAAGVPDVRAVPAPLFRQIVRMIGEIGTGMKIYNGKEVTGKFKIEVGRIYSKMKSELERIVDSTGQTDPSTGKPYSALMAKIDYRLRQLDYWKKAMGITEAALDRHGNIIGDRVIMNEQEGKRKAARTIRSFFGDSHHDIVKMAKQFQDDFGVDLLTPIRRSALGTRIGDQGALPAFPTITTTGGVPLAGKVTSLGIPLMTALGVGVTTRNPVLAAGAGLAAGTLSSPQFLVGALKAQQRIPPWMWQAASQLGPVAAGTEAVLTDRASKSLLNALAAARARPTPLLDSTVYQMMEEEP